ncbi:hypothetical protein DH2020_017044 [Rehmannia glutinosa]|uniref:CCT domain-containing protein n=1 Tax=Rehmannia glutinosa TaxID=99300 RepID=A0ABR0WT90_REHGL
MVPLMNCDINSSPVSVGSFSEQFGVSDGMGTVPQMSEIETGFADFAVSDDPHQVFESGEECIGMLPKFWPAYYPMATQNWALQGNPVVKKINEESEVKVGRYSVEERKDRILRYLNKRNHRNFNKTIKYACRKTLADKRVRVRGRFAKNNEPSDEEILLINTTHHNTANYHQQNNISNYEDSFQDEQDLDAPIEEAREVSSSDIEFVARFQKKFLARFRQIKDAEAHFTLQNALTDHSWEEYSNSEN